MIGCQEHIFLARTVDQYRLLEDKEPTRVTLVPPKFGGQKVGGTNLVAKSAPHPACRISNDANLWEMWKKRKISKIAALLSKLTSTIKAGLTEKIRSGTSNFPSPWVPEPRPCLVKMTGGAPEVGSDKSLTLLNFGLRHLIFDILHLTFNQWTNGPMGRWTDGPMDQWTNGPMVQWSNGPMDQWSNGLVTLVKSIALILF